MAMPLDMDTERNLLFALLAHAARLVHGAELIRTIRVWSCNRTRTVAELLANQGLLNPTQLLHLQGLVEGALLTHGGDALAALTFALAAQEGTDAVDPDLRMAVEQMLIPTVHETVLMTETRNRGRRTEVAETVDVALLANPALALKDQFPSGPRYTRTMLHASGGMGSVWLAHDSHIGRDVALKELHGESTPSGAVPPRFLREARITGQLEHPGIVPVYELGRDPISGRAFYTMRFVRGRTLNQAIAAYQEHRRDGQDDPFEFVTLLSALVSVCQTIAYAHSHGVVHRDLKGENVVLGDFGEVIVLDWGLAKHVSMPDDDATAEGATPESASSDSPASRTRMGQVMGTPAYMSPEQAQGRIDLIGPATDIFGAGAILYEILAGRPPFSGTTTMDVIHQARQGEIVPPSAFNPAVSPSLEAICMKALAREPGDRHANAGELAREVQGWQDRQRRQAEDELRRAGERLMHQQQTLVELTRSEAMSNPDLLNVYRHMIEASATTLDVERVSVWRYTQDRRAIRCHLLFERTTQQTSSGIELGAEMFPRYFEALQTSEVIPANNARTDPRTSEFTETYLTPLGIGAIMDAPLHVNGRMEGVVCHEHVGGTRQWTPDEQLFAIAVANLVSQAIGQHEQG